MISGLYKTTRNVTPQPVYVGDVIETTATMASGMDGGPLLDGSGQVIGLLSLNVSEARWLGTAVPVDAFVDRLIDAILEDMHPAQTPTTAADRSNVLTIVDAKGPSLFPRRDTLNAIFATAATSVAPAMVAITVDRKAEPPAAQNRRGRRPRQRRGRGYRSISERPDGPVTGWLLDNAGHVLTSWFNVWGELNAVTVTLDGQTLEATVLGHDEYRDLAVLKFDPGALEADTPLHPVRLHARPLPTGTPVAVAGLPPGAAGYTLTTGMISATGRLDGAAVQIDAPVNYGSAGGMLLDLEGRAVGLVTHVRTRSIWSQNSGVGLAVHAGSAQAVLERLKSGETIEKPKRGYLGIRMSSGDLKTQGVVVESIQEDTPAEEAGLREKDLITAVDGRPVSDATGLAGIIGGKAPGTRVTLTIERGGRSTAVELVLDEHPYR
jgi:S1-C subfamily serine protease